jgi:hypothetical protein
MNHSQNSRKFLLGFVLSLLALGFGAGRALAIVVNTVADSGSGSLRVAINTANSDSVPTTITFDPTVFPAAAPATILLASQLPALAGPGDVIDGTGSGVILDGSALSGSEVGIRVRASDIAVIGLTIQNFPEQGIQVQPPGAAGGQSVTGVVISGNTIVNNQDGLRVSGQTGPGNIVQVDVLNNFLDLNRDDGIFVRGSNDRPAGGGNNGNTVDIVLDGNSIFRSEGVETGGTRTGDGIRIFGGSEDGSGNVVTAVISNNNVSFNIDDGIIVAGAGGNGAASDNQITAQIINNRVSGPVNGKSVPGLAAGIRIRGGNRGGTPTALRGARNEIEFLIQNNSVSNLRDAGIFVGAGLGQFHGVTGDIVANDVQKIGCKPKDDPLLCLRGAGINIVTGEGNNNPGLNNSLQDISVLDNNVTDSLADGILIELGPGTGHTLSINSVGGNTSSKNGGDGIYVGVGVAGTGNALISQNRTDRNGQDGIDINASGFVILNNSARRNTGNGICVANGNIDGGGNTASKNGGSDFCQ